MWLGRGVEGRDGLHAVAEGLEVEIQPHAFLGGADVPVGVGVVVVAVVVVVAAGEGEFGDGDEDVGEAHPFDEGEEAVLARENGEEAVEVGFAGVKAGEEAVGAVGVG